MPRQRKATGSVHLTLFDSPYQQTVSDMIVQFQQQLAETTTPEERQELETAIKSWTAAHGEPQKSTQRASQRSTRCSSPKQKP